MSKNLWKLSVTYLFEDANFPIGALKPRSYNLVIREHYMFVYTDLRLLDTGLENWQSD